MTTIRCSSLPRLVACAAAGVKPDVRIEGDREPASLGTAFHTVMAATCRGESADVDQVAAENNVEARDLWPLVGWARTAWRDRLAAYFEGPTVEAQLETSFDGLTLT